MCRRVRFGAVDNWHTLVLFRVTGISIGIAVNVFIVATVVVFAVSLASIVAAAYTLVVKVKSTVEPQPPSRLRDR